MGFAGYFSIPGMQRGATAVTQYRGVIFDSTERRVLPVTNANASKPLGILQDDPAATDEPDQASRAANGCQGVVPRTALLAAKPTGPAGSRIQCWKYT